MLEMQYINESRLKPPRATHTHIDRITLDKQSDDILHTSQMDRIRVNIGGEMHELLRKTIEKYPKSRLAKMISCQSNADRCSMFDEFIPETNEYFFDRHPRLFQPVLSIYRTGEFHLVDGACPMQFLREIEYWELDLEHIAQCCKDKFIATYANKRLEEKKQEEKTAEENTIDNAPNSGVCVEFRLFVWNLLEKPDSSNWARAWHLFYVVLILIAVTTPVISTLPTMQRFSILDLYTGNRNETAQLPIVDYVEHVCVALFTLEYGLRFWASCNKCRFILTVLNIVDILTIAPFYVHYALMAVWHDLPFNFCIVFLALRIVRIFKLARHNRGLRALAYTVYRSYKEIGLLSLVFAFTILVFSTLAYFAEHEENPDMFGSIPHSLWWCVNTITTVGYGDVYPITTLGKIIGGCCAICSVLVLVLPTPIIVNNFAEFYRIHVPNFKVQTLDAIQADLKKCMTRKVITLSRRNSTSSVADYVSEPCRPSITPLSSHSTTTHGSFCGRNSL